MGLMDALAEAYANPDPTHVGAVAIGGAIMAWSLKRLIAEIRKTEKRVTAALEERNRAAAKLRQARIQEGELRDTLRELDGEMEEIAARAKEVEERRGTLEQVIPRHLNLFSQAWSPGDTLFEARISQVAGGGKGGARVVHGYAAGPRDFRNRLMARFPASSYVVIDVATVDLEELDMAVTNLGVANQP
ncbi:coiled-coil domain-containing protein [Nitrospirillum pindoramense]|uniref:Uncharacterized protein n=1 Tax=Nitrospirillum amazonense TaxID=28077 RepID=A0A560GPH7_9PROT|nr:hypothetical protein [Nitrospirillum amazonense]TWB35906.1 hypothetical protein FBZ90_118109 [Nitrospirillum amazonense]